MSADRCVICGRMASAFLQLHWHEPAGRHNSLRPRIRVCAGRGSCHWILSEGQLFAGLLLASRAERREGDVAAALLVGVAQALALQTRRAGPGAFPPAESWDQLGVTLARLLFVVDPRLFARRKRGLVGPNPRRNDRASSRQPKRRTAIRAYPLTRDSERMQADELVAMVVGLGEVLLGAYPEAGGELARLHRLHEGSEVLVSRLEELEEAGLVDAYRPAVEQIHASLDAVVSELRQARDLADLELLAGRIARLVAMCDRFVDALFDVAASSSVGEADHLLGTALAEAARMLGA